MGSVKQRKGTEMAWDLECQKPIPSDLAPQQGDTTQTFPNSATNWELNKHSNKWVNGGGGEFSSKPLHLVSSF